MTLFKEIPLRDKDYFRAVILYGANVAVIICQSELYMKDSQEVDRPETLRKGAAGQRC